MATATASGVDELHSGREEEGAEEGEEVGREQRVRERGERGLWASPWRPQKSRASWWKQELAHARAATTRPCSYWQEEEGDRSRGGGLA